jgi:hypothetical protein
MNTFTFNRKGKRKNRQGGMSGLKSFGYCSDIILVNAISDMCFAFTRRRPHVTYSMHFRPIFLT